MLFIVLVILGWLHLGYRALGRSLYAIGGSPEVARLAGIRVRQLTTWVYVGAGILSALAGIVLFGLTRPNQAPDLVMSSTLSPPS